MTKEMLSFFGMTGIPFSKEIDTKNLVLLPSMEKSLTSLKFLASVRGIGLLTGKSGTGKSCLIRLFQDSLHSGLFKPLYICHTTTGVNEFYSHLCHALGLESRFRKAAMFRAVQEKIISMNKTGRIHPVLVIDETQLLSNDILAELRLLTNFEIDSVNALTVLMCGQENLRQRFGLSVLESLANSITVSVNVEALPKEETFLYIEQMVTLTGVKKPLFTKAAIEFIHQASGGILRAINAVANAALGNAFMKKAEIVEVEHARAMMER